MLGFLSYVVDYSSHHFCPLAMLDRADGSCGPPLPEDTMLSTFGLYHNKGATGYWLSLLLGRLNGSLVEEDWAAIASEELSLSQPGLTLEHSKADLSSSLAEISRPETAEVLPSRLNKTDPRKRQKGRRSKTLFYPSVKDKLIYSPFR